MYPNASLSRPIASRAIWIAASAAPASVSLLIAAAAAYTPFAYWPASRYEM